MTGGASTRALHPQAEESPVAAKAANRTVAVLAVLAGLALFGVLVIVGVLMRFAQSGTLGISPAWFYRLMTLHGAGMITAALLSMMGALWFVLRTDVALNAPRMWASFLAMVIGAVSVLIATMLGRFAAGWTFLWPLPYDAVGQWSRWATILFLIGVLLVGVGFCIFCIDVLEKTTIAFGGLDRTLGITYLRGRDPHPPPPTATGAVVVAMAGLAASAGGTTVLAGLLVYSYDSSARIDALWAKNLTYFFGHTAANLIIYLAACVVYVLLPLYTGRRWKTSAPLVVGWLLTLVFVLTAYSHHLYMDTVQPRALEYISNGVSDAAAIPVAVVTIYTGMMLVWGSGYRWTLASRLLYLGFAGWAIGGVGAVIDAILPVNARLHNTDWVPAHFHTYLLVGVMFWVFAFVAHILEVRAPRPSVGVNAWLAPALMVVGGYGLTGVWYAAGALGVPRRYAVQPPGTDGYSLAGGVFGLVFLVGFIAMVTEFAVLARRARVGQRPAFAGEGDLTASQLHASWRAFRERLQLANRQSLGHDDSAGHRTPAKLDPGPYPTVPGANGRIAAYVLAGIAAVLSFPPMYGNAEDNPHVHHLIHAGQFFAGALVGVAVASRAGVFRRLAGGIGDAVSLTFVIAAPLAMMLLMAPRLYGPLDRHAAAHVAYHAGVTVLGLLTGVGCARLGKAAGWFMVFSSFSMALLWAVGVTGA